MASNSIYDYALERLRNNDTLSADEIVALERNSLILDVIKTKQTPKFIFWRRIIELDDGTIYAIDYKRKRSKKICEYAVEYIGQPYRVKYVQRDVVVKKWIYEPIEECAAE